MKNNPSSMELQQIKKLEVLTPRLLQSAMLGFGCEQSLDRITRRPGSPKPACRGKQSASQSTGFICDSADPNDPVETGIPEAARSR